MTIAVGGAVRPDPAFQNAILEGLRADRKTISSKWLYDEEGSRLFDAITTLPEYYPTRTETGILKQRAAELAGLVPPDSTLIELGSGSSTKTRILLDTLPSLTSYVPVDISAAFLHMAAQRLVESYPRLTVHPVVADFTRSFTVPEVFAQTPKLLFFPGSTIGNFTTTEARGLLTGLARIDNVAGFVIGVDLKKDPATLVSAYDDRAGVTAAFNLNLLKRLNRELAADFDLDAFNHEARWNADDGRIEMHLVSQRDQSVDILGEAISFRAGETIHTENSHKYDLAGFRRLAASAGWGVDAVWTDKGGKFSVQVLRLQP
ncbi:MAG: L-histidine N(alpha)-methyltransferase [Alphaproteobacteria bacterium]